VTPKINGQTLKMELDTDSAVSTLPVQKYKEMFPNTPLVETGVCHWKANYMFMWNTTTRSRT